MATIPTFRARSLPRPARTVAVPTIRAIMAKGWAAKFTSKRKKICTPARITEAYANSPLDPPDYTVGEGVDLDGTGPIRYMFDPSRSGDPKCYSTAIPSAEAFYADWGKIRVTRGGGSCRGPSGAGGGEPLTRLRSASAGA